MVDFESVAAKLSTIDESGLSQVSKLAQLQLQLEQRVYDLEADLKQAKIDLKQVAEDQLPAAMAEHNVTEFKLADGSGLILLGCVALTLQARTINNCSLLLYSLQNLLKLVMCK